MVEDIWIPYTTIVRKEVTRIMRIWSQTLLPPVITQTLYFVIFGKFIGAQIQSVKGLSYMSFIVPGLVMMSIINSSFANVVSSFFGAKFQRNIEELIVSPTPPWVMLAGYVTGGLIRGLSVGALVFCVSVFFTRPHIEHPALVFFFMILTSILFSLGGVINAIFAKKFDDISFFPNFILTPLTYLGGVFYSLSNLPAAGQHFSSLNPIVYMIDGFRFGFYGVGDIPVFISIIILTILIFVFSILAIYLLNRGVGIKA